MVFDSTAIKTHQVDSNNSTIHCILSHDQGVLNSNFNTKWTTIVQLLETVSQAVLCISTLELLASQTPYSMRGLMFGVCYAGILLFTLLGNLTFWLVTQQSSTWATAIISCEFWYLFSLLLGLIIFSGQLLAVGRWYKNRKREDVLPNKHIFAERYYSRM